MKNTSKKTKTAKQLTVTCRFMEKGDERGVAKVHAEAFDSDPTRALDTATEHNGETKDHGAVVALVGKTVVGYAFFSVSDSDSDSKSGKDMYISNVGVRKSHRGKGVCGSMIPWLLARIACFNCTTASLYVVSDTDAAVRCYKSHGFAGEGESSSLTYRPKRRRKCPTSTMTLVCATGDCH
jgi:ribosomal protein S18 acetylase RimI-like enzyme